MSDSVATKPTAETSAASSALTASRDRDLALKEAKKKLKKYRAKQALSKRISAVPSNLAPAPANATTVTMATAAAAHTLATSIGAAAAQRHSSANDISSPADKRRSLPSALPEPAHRVSGSAVNFTKRASSQGLTAAMVQSGGHSRSLSRAGHGRGHSRSGSISVNPGSLAGALVAAAATVATTKPHHVDTLQDHHPPSRASSSFVVVKPHATHGRGHSRSGSITALGRAARSSAVVLGSSTRPSDWTLSSTSSVGEDSSDLREQSRPTCPETLAQPVPPAKQRGSDEAAANAASASAAALSPSGTASPLPTSQSSHVQSHSRRPSRHARRASVSTKRESIEIMGGLGIPGLDPNVESSVTTGRLSLSVGGPSAAIAGTSPSVVPAGDRTSRRLSHTRTVSGLLPAPVLVGMPTSLDTAKAGGDALPSTDWRKTSGDGSPQEGHQDDGRLTALQKLEGRGGVGVVSDKASLASPGARSPRASTGSTSQHGQGASRPSSVQLPTFDEVHGTTGIEISRTLSLLEANESTTNSSGGNRQGEHADNKANVEKLVSLGPAGKVGSIANTKASSARPSSIFVHPDSIQVEGLGTLMEEEEEEEGSPTKEKTNLAALLPFAPASPGGDTANGAESRERDRIETVKRNRRDSLTPKPLKLKSRPASLYFHPTMMRSSAANVLGHLGDPRSSGPAGEGGSQSLGKSAKPRGASSPASQNPLAMDIAEANSHGNGHQLPATRLSASAVLGNARPAAPVGLSTATSTASAATPPQSAWSLEGAQKRLAEARQQAATPTTTTTTRMPLPPPLSAEMKALRRSSLPVAPLAPSSSSSGPTSHPTSTRAGMRQLRLSSVLLKNASVSSTNTAASSSGGTSSVFAPAPATLVGSDSQCSTSSTASTTANMNAESSPIASIPSAARRASLLGATTTSAAASQYGSSDANVSATAAATATSMPKALRRSSIIYKSSRTSEEDEASSSNAGGAALAATAAASGAPSASAPPPTSAMTRSPSNATSSSESAATALKDSIPPVHSASSALPPSGSSSVPLGVFEELKAAHQRSGSLLDNFRRQVERLTRELAVESERSAREYTELERWSAEEKRTLGTRIEHLEADAARAVDAVKTSEERAAALRADAEERQRILAQNLEDAEAERDMLQDDVEGWRMRCQDLEKRLNQERATSDRLARAHAAAKLCVRQLVDRLVQGGIKVPSNAEDVLASSPLDESVVGSASAATAPSFPADLVSALRSPALGSSSPVMGSSPGGSYFSPSMTGPGDTASASPLPPPQAVQLLKEMRQQIFNLVGSLEHERKEHMRAQAEADQVRRENAALLTELHTGAVPAHRQGDSTSGCVSDGGGTAGHDHAAAIAQPPSPDNDKAQQDTPAGETESEAPSPVKGAEGIFTPASAPPMSVVTRTPAIKKHRVFAYDSSMGSASMTSAGTGSAGTGSTSEHDLARMYMDHATKDAEATTHLHQAPHPPSDAGLPVATGSPEFRSETGALPSASDGNPDGGVAAGAVNPVGLQPLAEAEEEEDEEMGSLGSARAPSASGPADAALATVDGRERQQQQQQRQQQEVSEDVDSLFRDTQGHTCSPTIGPVAAPHEADVEAQQLQDQQSPQEDDLSTSFDGGVDAERWRHSEDAESVVPPTPALEHSKSLARSDQGTQHHEFTERLDRGDAVSSVPSGQVPVLAIEGQLLTYSNSKSGSSDHSVHSSESSNDSQGPASPPPPSQYVRPSMEGIAASDEYEDIVDGEEGDDLVEIEEPSEAARPEFIPEWSFEQAFFNLRRREQLIQERLSSLKAQHRQRKRRSSSRSAGGMESMEVAREPTQNAKVRRLRRRQQPSVDDFFGLLHQDAHERKLSALPVPDEALEMPPVRVIGGGMPIGFGSKPSGLDQMIQSPMRLSIITADGIPGQIPPSRPPVAKSAFALGGHMHPAAVEEGRAGAPTQQQANANSGLATSVLSRMSFQGLTSAFSGLGGYLTGAAAGGAGPSPYQQSTSRAQEQFSDAREMVAGHEPITESPSTWTTQVRVHEPSSTLGHEEGGWYRSGGSAPTSGNPLGSYW